MRSADVFFQNEHAGRLIEDDEGYHFFYLENYLEKNGAPISLTLPLEKKSFTSKMLFPFFDGLIPEGWLLDLATTNWKVNPRDRMGLLLTLCVDSIGAVSIKETKE